jgi:hypothetical protein
MKIYMYPLAANGATVPITLYNPIFSMIPDMVPTVGAFCTHLFAKCGKELMES